MASTSPARIWVMRLAFCGLALMVIFFHLLPLDTSPIQWAPPDVLLALVLVWSARRPDFVPAPLIAAVMLMADLMLQRPPGLMAMLVVLGSEYLKGRAHPQLEAGFAAEWIAAAAAITVITLGNRLILGMVAVEQASIGLILIQMVLTIAVYPLLVMVSQSLMKVRKLSPAAADALGGRL
jgi:rod shape-determining protein MreD